MKKNYQNIIWDWNGTLLDDAWLCVEIMNKLLNKQNLPLLSINSYQNIFTFPIRKYYDSLGFNYEIESFETVATNFIQLYEKRKFECSLHEKTVDVLDYFNNQNKKQYILSASKIDSLREITSFYKLEKYFHSLNGLDDHYAHGKVDVGHNLLKKEKLDKSQTLLIGDTDHDCEVGIKLDIDTILIENGHNSKSRLLACSQFVYLDLGELIK